MLRILAIAFALFVALPTALASPPELVQAATTAQDNADLPRGAPYHVDPSGDNKDVPLRDYLSSRIDQLRAEMVDRFNERQKLDEERDVRYSQRFAAQQEALASALQAVKESGANALAAAKEAIIKAESASDKRFESMNEFRKQLDDQASTFVSKDASEARFNSLEEKTVNLTQRLDAIKNISEGAGNLWAYIIGGGGLLLAAIAFFNKTRAT